MNTTGQMQGIIRDPDRLPRYAQYGLLLLVIGVSVTGWITAVPFGGFILAAIAACLEVHIFFGLPKWLDHCRRRQWAKIGLLSVILAMAGIINSVGLDCGLQFVGATMQAPLDAQVRAEQSRLDQRRANALTHISELEARLLAHSAQTPPDAATTSRARQQEWRQNYEAGERTLRAQLSDARSGLGAIALTAAPRYAYPPEARHLAAGFLFFISMFVRFAWGFEARVIAKPEQKTSARPPTTPRKRRKKVSQAKPSQVSQPAVIDLGTERAARDKRDAETVARMTAEGLSFRDIERETNKQISRSRAQRLLSAR